MTNLRVLLAAATLPFLTTAPAQAEDVYVGLKCGMLTTTDPTGLISQDPNTYTGVVHGGPIAVVNTAGGTVTSVTITCSVQINCAPHGCNVVARRSATCSGNACVLVDTIQYNASPGDSVYLCTEIAWTSTKGGGSVQFDKDDIVPGAQCRLVTTVEDGNVIMHIAEPPNMAA